MAITQKMWFLRARRYIGWPIVTIGVGLVVGIAVTGFPTRTAAPPVATVLSSTTLPDTATTVAPAAFSGISITVLNLGAPEGADDSVMTRLTSEFNLSPLLVNGDPTNTSYVAASPDAELAAQAVAALLGIVEVRLNALSGEIRIEIGLGRDFVP